MRGAAVWVSARVKQKQEAVKVQTMRLLALGEHLDAWRHNCRIGQLFTITPMMARDITVAIAALEKLSDRRRKRSEPRNSKRTLHI